jgi:hypothetical protein
MLPSFKLKPIMMYPPLREPHTLTSQQSDFHSIAGSHSDWRVLIYYILQEDIRECVSQGGNLGRKETSQSSRYSMCGGFCRRTRSPHFFAALSNSRWHECTLISQAIHNHGIPVDSSLLGKCPAPRVPQHPYCGPNVNIFPCESTQLLSIRMVKTKEANGRSNSKLGN